MKSTRSNAESLSTQDQQVLQCVDIDSELHTKTQGIKAPSEARRSQATFIREIMNNRGMEVD